MSPKVKGIAVPNEPRVLPVRNPYTGEVDYAITPPTARELAATCASLRAGQAGWAAAGLEHRTEVLLRWAGELDKAYGALSAADSADTGGCLISIMAPGIVAASVRSWAADAPAVLAAAARAGTSSIMPTISFRTQLVPYQLVGVISPWNGPLMMSCLDAVPALFAGAAVIAFLTLFKTRDVGTNSFGASGLGGDRTGPGSILRFVRKKALMTQSAVPSPLTRPAPLARPAGAGPAGRTEYPPGVPPRRRPA